MASVFAFGTFPGLSKSQEEGGKVHRLSPVEAHPLIGKKGHLSLGGLLPSTLPTLACLAVFQR